jgi:hypothetical protein
MKSNYNNNRVSGCVGFENYKFFFLFVFYTGFYGLWIFVSALPTVVTAINDMVIIWIFFYNNSKQVIKRV